MGKRKKKKNDALTLRGSSRARQGKGQRRTSAQQDTKTKTDKVMARAKRGPRKRQTQSRRFGKGPRGWREEAKTQAKAPVRKKGPVVECAICHIQYEENPGQCQNPNGCQGRIFHIVTQVIQNRMYHPPEVKPRRKKTIWQCAYCSGQYSSKPAYCTNRVRYGEYCRRTSFTKIEVEVD